MRPIPLWLLFCLPLCGWAWIRPTLHRVDLEILDGHFVRLQVGSPEHTYAFYLDLEYGGILISRTDPELQSNTFEIQAGGQHSDLFMIGGYALRLPYNMGTFTYDRAIQLSSQQTPVGKIGLAANSPLWRYWDNFTLTNNRLRLGSLDAVTDEIPILASGVGYCENPETGTSAGLEINFGKLNLLLPHSLNEEQPSTLLIRSCANPETCPDSVEIKVHNQDIDLIGGLSFLAVDQSHDGLVHLGRRFFYDVHLFIDWSTNTMILSDLQEFNVQFTRTYVILASAVFFVWLLPRLHPRKNAHPTAVTFVAQGYQQQAPKVYVKQEQPQPIANPAKHAASEMERFLNFFVEWLIIQLAFAYWVTNFFIFHWASAIEKLLDERAVFATVSLHFAVVCSLVTCGCLLYIEYQHVRDPSRTTFNVVWHLLGLINLLLPLLWSGFVQHHHLLTDIGFLLFFSTIWAVVNGVIFLHSCLLGSYGLQIVSGFAMAVSYIFICVCNVIPFYEVLHVGEHVALFVLQYLLVFCLIPTLLILMAALRHYITKHPDAVRASDLTRGDFLTQYLIADMLT